MAKKPTKAEAKATEDILDQSRRRFNANRTADKSERILSYEDTRFAVNDDGCQWNSVVRNKRENAVVPRPCLVMNKIPEKIDQAEGEFRQLRPAIKVVAVDSQADPKIADILSGIIRHIEYNSTARSAYNTSHSSVLYGGRGAWRISIVDSEDDPFEQDVSIDRIPNPLSVTWDQAAKKVDKSDGNHLHVTEDIPIADFKKEYPNASIADWPDEDSYKGWQSKDTIRVAEYWWKEPGKKEAFRVERNGTQITVWEQKEGDKLLDQKMVNHPNVRWCKMTANEILEGPFDDWPSKYIPIILEFGKEVNINGKIKTRGMTRFAIDPQKMYNYGATSEAEALQAGKQPYLMTPKMMGPHQTQWDKIGTENMNYLYFEPDPKIAGMGPRKEQPQQASTATLMLKQGMEHDIMSAMNVYAAQIGDQGKEVSGVAIQARTAQGKTGGFTYTDNFEYAFIYSAKVLIDVIPHIYSSERIMRIRGESGTERVVPINARPDSPILQQQQFAEKDVIKTNASEYINDITIGKYDVIAKIGPAYATQREEALEMMLKLVELIPGLGTAAPDLIVKLLDAPLSEEFFERVKKLVPPAFRTPEPGEEPEPEQPPDPMVVLKQKELELKGIEEMRKGFTAKFDAIAKIMTAEAKEEGQQFQAVMQIIDQVKNDMAAEQAPQPTQGA